MEKITEIDTLKADESAFEVILKCKNIASSIDICNIINDNTCIEEKEMLIDLIESIKNLELEIIEVPFIPRAQA
tara:strand:+ start:2361 stop:2582 length:222 start_codon:yes stop_codon:yes gene_type:complete